MTRSLTAFFALCATVFLGYLLEGGRAVFLLHPAVPGIVMISLSSALAAFLLFPKPIRKRALQDLEEGAQASPASVAVWRFLERISYGTGVLALLLGLLISAGFLDMPVWVVGGKVGACLVMLAYGVLQGLAMTMLRARVEAHAAAPAPTPRRKG